MPLLRELGTAVRRRRREIGLSQRQLSDLVELSRATINELETGKLKELASTRVERVANELGFAVGLVGTRRPNDRSALEAAARVGSVPYANQMPASALLDSLKAGVIAPAYIAHLRTLLQEAPVATLAAVVDELHDAHGIPRPDSWARMRALATALKCDRPLWQAKST